jgi:hypothetical protein
MDDLLPHPEIGEWVVTGRVACSLPEHAPDQSLFSGLEHLDHATKQEMNFRAVQSPKNV